MEFMSDLLKKKSTYIFLAATIFVVILPHYSSAYALRLMITMASSIIAAMCLNVVLGYMGYPSLCQNVFYACRRLHHGPGHRCDWGSLRGPPWS